MSQQRVLIVDDDPAVREILAAILARENVATDVVSDGEQAVKMLGEQTYGAVLLDLLLPRMTGTDVIAYMRKEGITTPVIVISAVSDETHDLDPNVVRVAMQKPIELQDLRTVVKAVLRAV
jgi:DNA-binding response OmpR family regulator